jgi:stalled ribosome alternative rescue factor ArfA
MNKINIEIPFFEAFCKIHENLFKYLVKKKKKKKGSYIDKTKF